MQNFPEYTRNSIEYKRNFIEYKRNKSNYLKLSTSTSTSTSNKLFKIKPQQTILFGGSSKSMLIVLPSDSTGLIHDALVFEEYFKKFMKDLQITIITPKNQFDQKSIQNEKKVDFVLYLETMTNDNVGLIFDSKYCMFMINQEFFFYDSIKKKIRDYQFKNKITEKRDIDLFICKTKEGVRFLEEIVGIKNNKIFYTKFSTIFPTLQLKKNYSKMFHGAGRSHLKGTDIVLNTWEKNKGKLPELVILCYDSCLDNLKKYLKSDILDNSNTYNVTLMKEKQPYEDVVKLKNEIGFHLCPSMIEGYGHYLNEARIVSAVTMTLDAPPMNEIIDDTCGILIPYTQKLERTNKSNMYLTTEKNILEGVERMLKLTDQERDKLGCNARKKYEEDTNFFAERIKELCEKISSN